LLAFVHSNAKAEDAISRLATTPPTTAINRLFIGGVPSFHGGPGDEASSMRRTLWPLQVRPSGTLSVGTARRRMRRERVGGFQPCLTAHALAALRTGGLRRAGDRGPYYAVRRDSPYGRARVREVPEMPKFMDVHHGMHGVTPEALQAAHQADLDIQNEEGVDFQRAWGDPDSGMVWCISEAPSADAVKRIHERTGHPATEVYPVPVEV
jgi:hypothetical protein